MVSLLFTGRARPEAADQDSRSSPLRRNSATRARMAGHRSSPWLRISVIQVRWFMPAQRAVTVSRFTPARNANSMMVSSVPMHRPATGTVVCRRSARTMALIGFE